MAQRHEVTLTLLSTGTVVDVWDRYTIVQDMLSPGAGWTFSFWRSQTRNATWDVLKREVRFGAKILLAIDEAPQLCGVIERIQFRASRAGAQLVIGGRDMAGAAVTAHADPHVTFRGQALEDVIRALVEPLGISVVVGANADAARQAVSGARRGTRGWQTTSRRNIVDQLHPRPGETIWSLIDKLCRRVGLLAWVAPDADGALALVIDAPVSTGVPDYRFRWIAPVDGQSSADTNLIESEWSLDYTNVPTSVSVMAHEPRGDRLPARTEVTLLNDVTSSHRFAATNPPPVPHPRYLESHNARGNEHARSEARRMIAEANAEFETYSCVVQGHSQVSASQAGTDILYAINSVAHVRDDIPGVDKDMIVRRIEFTGGRGEGQLTRLTMHPLGSIEIIPETT